MLVVWRRWEANIKELVTGQLFMHAAACVDLETHCYHML